MTVGLLQAADSVLQSRRARDRPGASERVLVAQVGPVLPVARFGLVVEFCGERRIDDRQVGEFGDPPRLGAVGEVAVGEQDHRGAVGDRDPGRLQCGVEAVAGGARRDHGHGRLAVAAEHRLQQVGLLGLGRQSRRRASPLDVDHQQGQFGHYGQPDRLGLQRQAGARGGRDPQLPHECRTERGTDAGDLVLGLERRHAEALVLAQLVQDVGGRRDRVGPEEDRQP